MIKSKVYAKNLVDLFLNNKSLTEEKKFVDSFLMFLEKNQDIKKAKEIIQLAENLYFKKTGKRKITLESARSIDAETAFKSFFNKGDFAEEKINQELVAGVKIIVNNEKQLDFSLKNKIDNIF